jgi:ribosome-binding protein aMBF1 (putative translation factor)
MTPSLDSEPSTPLSISMNIGTTIRDYRLQKGMSQGDIEKRTGLLRCYLSRVENGHTVPSLETLQKIARALDLQLSQFFAEETVSKEMSTTPPTSAKAIVACSSPWCASSPPPPWPSRLHRHIGLGKPLIN